MDWRGANSHPIGQLSTVGHIIFLQRNSDSARTHHYRLFPCRLKRARVEHCRNPRDCQMPLARKKIKPRAGVTRHPGAKRTPKPEAHSDLHTGSSAPLESAARSLEAGIGGEVRRLRKSLALTGAELAVAAGISAGMLSKIENAAISPSLATLDALAKSLNVPISRLFAETDERRDCSFVKAGGGVRIERRGTKSGHKYDLLGHSLAGEIGVEPYLINLAEDAVP